jgi:hypothetical protein
MLRLISITIAAVLTMATVAIAQTDGLTGSWHGTLSNANGSLRLIFQIEQTTEAYSASIVSVDQGAAVIPVDISVSGDSVVFTNAQYDINYQAEVSGSEMTGTFTQFGNEFPDFKIVQE